MKPNSRPLILGRRILSANKSAPLHLHEEDRFFHIHIIGRPGTGKSSLLLSLALQDMANGKGFCFLDPHGQGAETLIQHVPPHRMADVVYIDVSNLDHPIGINPLYGIPPNQHAVACSDLLEAFQGIWSTGWGDRMEDILRACIFTLLAYPDIPGVSLMAIPRLLNDAKFRAHCIQYLTNPQVRSYWLDEYNNYDENFRRQITVSVLNKMRVFLADPLMVNIIGQAVPRFSMLEAIKRQQIVIVNLARGSIGAKNTKFLGNLLAAHVRQLCFSPQTQGLPFHLYLDEFHTFDSKDFAVALAEARKFQLSYTLSHQFLSQLELNTRHAVEETVGNLFVFGLGINDAPTYAELLPPTPALTLQHQSTGQATARIMKENQPLGPLTLETFNAAEVGKSLQPKDTSRAVRNQSIRRYGIQAARVEQNHLRWFARPFGQKNGYLGRKMRQRMKSIFKSIS